MNTVGIEDDIARRMAEQMAEQIDWEILCEILIDSGGWTKIVMNRVPFSLIEISEMKLWCRENIKGNYKARGDTWLFEYEQDAMMFSLQWL